MTQAQLTLAQALRDAGIDPRDARLLLAQAANIPPDRLTLHAQDPLPNPALARFRDMVDRRRKGEPVSRILGYRDFWGHRFSVTPDVLDPRPETEGLVAAALETPAATFLDLGTGTGCIPISLLTEWPDAHAIAIDVSDAALNVARQNAEAMNVADRITFRQSDWFENVVGKFDLITSNPPYITAEEMHGLSVEVARHDPHLALSPGGDGLGAYRIIAAQAGAFLHAHGRLLLEIGASQGKAVQAILIAAGWDDIQILPDFDGRARVISAKINQTG